MQAAAEPPCAVERHVPNTRKNTERQMATLGRLVADRSP